MGKIIFYIFIALFSSSVALAQSLVPATSEDLAEFDSQISRTKKSPAASRFDTKVSEEAKALQSSAAQKKNSAATTALDSRDKSQAGGNGASNSVKDAKVSSPSNNDHGNSANAPGRNKKK